MSGPPEIDPSVELELEGPQKVKTEWGLIGLVIPLLFAFVCLFAAGWIYGRTGN